MRINEIEIRAYVVLTKVFVEFVQKKNIIGAEKLLDSMTRNQYFDFLDILTFKYGDKYSKLADKMWEKLEMNIGDKKTNEYKLVESRIAKIVKKVIRESFRRSGNMEYTNGNLLVRFQKVGSSLYATVFLPHVSDTTPLMRFTNPISIGVKAFLNHVENSISGIDIKSITQDDFDKQSPIAMKLYKQLDNFRHKLMNNKLSNDKTGGVA